jgi:hypothetical protein
MGSSLLSIFLPRLLLQDFLNYFILCKECGRCGNDFVLTGLVAAPAKQKAQKMSIGTFLADESRWLYESFREKEIMWKLWEYVKC